MKNRKQGIAIHHPLVIMYQEEAGGNIICRIHPRTGDHHGHYGILICDLVRHVANAFDVHENDVWEWVDKERLNPTGKAQKQPDRTWKSGNGKRRDSETAGLKIMNDMEKLCSAIFN
jgi:hypothetical protein